MKIQVLVLEFFEDLSKSLFLSILKMDYGHSPCSKSLTFDDLILNYGSLPRKLKLENKLWIFSELFSSPWLVILDIFDHSPGESDHNHLKNVQFVSHLSHARKWIRQKLHIFSKNVAKSRYPRDFWQDKVNFTPNQYNRQEIFRATILRNLSFPTFQIVYLRCSLMRLTNCQSW